MDLLAQDPKIAQLLQKELQRQTQGLELIASENYVSLAVLQATGSVLTNKYAEGYPGKRYYGGCEFVDSIESLGIQRAKQLFQGAEHANVQPHSGSQANMAAFLALAPPGSRIMGLDLASGGHLTHGAKVNFSGFLYEAHSYGLGEGGLLDYELVERRAREVRPHILIGGHSAYPRTMDFQKLSHIAQSVGAKFVVDMAHIAGLVATDLHPSPVPYADCVTSTTHKTLRGPRGGLILCKSEWAKKVDAKIFPGIQGGPLQHIVAAKAVAFGEALTAEFKTYCQKVIENAQTLAKSLEDLGFCILTGGTDNHLLLIDFSNGTFKGLTGLEAQERLEQVGITTNKNTVPGEKRPPFITSGLRLGTPALTSRSMGIKEMQQIAHFIAEALKDTTKNPTALREQVLKLCANFPAPARLER